MKMIFVRTLVAMLVALFAPVLFWIGGFNFVRGEFAVYCTLLTVFVFAMGVTCPYWDKQ